MGSLKECADREVCLGECVNHSLKMSAPSLCHKTNRWLMHTPVHSPRPAQPFQSQGVAARIMRMFELGNLSLMVTSSDV